MKNIYTVDDYGFIIWSLYKCESDDYQCKNGEIDKPIPDNLIFIKHKWDGEMWIEGGTPPKSNIETLAIEARVKRNGLLAETDGLMLPDVPITEDSREALISYRQALRNIPEQEGFPNIINWPDYPVIEKAS